MSNRLTFSLASLIVLLTFGLVFGTVPVLANDGVDPNHGADGHDDAAAATAAEAATPDHRHPTVSIELIDADVSVETNGVQDYNGYILEDTPFRLKFTFSHPVSGFTADDIDFLDADADGAHVSGVTLSGIADATTFTAVTPTGGTASTTEYTIDAELVDSDSDADADPVTYTTVTQLKVLVAANEATGIGQQTFVPTGGQGNLRATDLDIMVVPNARTLTAPPAPENLEATPGIQSITLTWDVVTGAAYEYMMDAGAWMDVPASAISATGASLTVPSTSTTSVMFNVREPAAGHVPAGASASVSATPDPVPLAPPAGAPASIIAVAGNGEVTLTWAVVDGATRYESSTDGNAWAPIDAADIDMSDDGTMVSTIVTGLTNGTTVSFQVRGANSAGDGAASIASASVTPMAPTVVPGPVTSLTAEAGNGQVALTWVAPTTGGTVVNYEYSMDNGATWMDIPNSNAATTSYTVMSLTNEQTYNFIVRAENAGGMGVQSNEISSTPILPAAPAAPASLTAEAGDAQVTLTWAVVEGATSYESSTDGGTAWAPIDAADITMSDDGTMASTIVTGLTNGTEVSFQVRAVGPGGDGAASVAAKATPAGARVTKYDKDTGITTLSGTIPANGFLVIGHADLPDLEEFFDVGGTIDLDNGDAVDDKNSRTVVISEILWGLDFGATGIDHQKQWQFIELYNTTGTAINLSTSTTNWMLKFSEDRNSTDAIDIDQVSNRPPLHVGFDFDIGQSGRVTGTTAADANNLRLPISVISMYRNITYATVEKTNHDADATKNRNAQLGGIPSGNAKDSWKASTRRDPATPDGVDIAGLNAARWVYASRGEQHYTTTAILTASTVSKTPFVINEIGNGVGDTNDWVEIRNLDSAEKSLNNYHLSIVKAVGTDDSLVNFKDKDIKVPGNGFIVIANTSPTITDLAAGRNAAIAPDDQVLTGVDSVYYVDGNLKLPTDGKFNLILRNAHDKLKASSNFVDVVGGQVYKDVSKATNLWPLIAAGAPNGDVIDGQGRDLKEGFVYKRNNQGGLGAIGEHHLGRIGYTGIGYDRAAADTPANGGTPGFDNGASKDKIAGLTTGDITISEIMIDTGQARQSLAQWIELHNSSMDQAVNLNGWKLHIENAANGNGELETNTFSATLTLGNVTISPNQTVLIASSTGRVSDPDHFPSTRVINLWTTKAHRDALEMTRRTDPVLSTTGFNVTLADKDNVEVDSAGNLDGNRRTRDDIAWTLPVGDDDARRSSLLRVYDDGVAVKGTMEEAWVLADQTNLAFAISQTYYGDSDDFGTPGFRAGGPLPVSLSKFRPERLDDGTIAIRWVTESELNNAGFNILRSETKDGEFKQINTKLIAGKGTTSERSTYTYTDPSAKPNVVYYYQIQDVSLDGKVTTLRETRLKGHISAAGKLTTTWGELKALQ